MSKAGRTWKRADKIKLAEAVKMVREGKGMLEVANHLGLSYGQVYRAFRAAIAIPETNTGEEKTA